MRMLMLFLDGVGIGEKDPAKNPFCASSHHLLDNFLESKRIEPIPFGGRVKGIDASLGISGLPQSGTGQATLLTGINASQELGHHLSGFPNKKIKELILKHSLLKQLKEKGKDVRFVNVYRPIFFQLGDKIKKVKLSATTYANLAADLPFLSIEDILAEKGIYQEFTNLALRNRGFDVPLFTPPQAGEILANIAQNYDFTLYEYFQSDKAGHSQNMEWGQQEVHKLEAFLVTLLSNINLKETLVFLTSDHGNLEDLSTRSHTENPSILLAWGKGSEKFIQQIDSLIDVTPTVLASFS